jgi:hypothetical protein
MFQLVVVTQLLTVASGLLIVRTFTYVQLVICEPNNLCVQAKIQEMKEKDTDPLSDKDGNSHVCKVCFESATAAVLLPCRHFCCKLLLCLRATFVCLFVIVDTALPALTDGVPFQCASLARLPVQSALCAAQE